MAVVTATDSARELSAEEIQARRDECYALEQVIKGSIQLGRQAMWDLAKALYEFNEANGWTALGYSSQGEWLAQPEVDMTKRTFHRYVRAYTETVVRREIPMETMETLDQSKIDIVLPAIESAKVTVDEAFEDVRSLGARDLREKYIGPQAPPKKRGEGEPDASGTDSTGKTTTTDSEASKASEHVKGTVVVDDGEEPYFQAGAAVDSWMDMGGDKRKAVRGWAKFRSTHPVLVAVDEINSVIQGEEYNGSTLSKEDAKMAWHTLCSALGLEYDAA